MSALIYTSTPSVVSGLTDLENADESVSYPTHYDADYGRTKAEAERLVLWSACEALKTVALRPPLVWGPGDTSLLPRVIERGAKRLAPTNKGAAHVDGYHLHRRRGPSPSARCRSAPGRRRRSPPYQRPPYFVSSGDPVEIWEFINGLLSAGGVPAVRRVYPSAPHFWSDGHSRKSMHSHGPKVILA